VGAWRAIDDLSEGAGRLLFPGDPGVPPASPPSTIVRSCRRGHAWDPFGDNKNRRAGRYGIFYDGLPMAWEAAAGVQHALPWTQGISCPARDSTWPIPYAVPLPHSAAGISSRRPPLLTVQSGMRPPYSQNWNFVYRTGRSQKLSARRSLRWQQGHASAALHRSQSVYLRAGRQRE